ncbi:MAG TPA: SpoIID/LytB domain-containing protein [Candidatus Acidoferrum sp.]
MRARALLLLLFFSLAARSARAQDVRIGVFGIFHPRQLTLSTTGSEALVVAAGDQAIFLQPRSSRESLQIRADGNSLLLSVNGREIHANEIQATSRNNRAARFVLRVPEKISRQYLGTLDVKAINGELVPVVTMDRETAVASVVQAESLPGTPMEALKAQAVVTRSYFVAGGGRHADFDFCDLTHCQFLREPPPPQSPAALAANATQDLIINFADKPVAAMFTRSCSGATRTPADIGISSNGYPYFSVVCDFCYKNPVRWTRTVSPQDAALLKDHSEVQRLAVAKRLGWSAVPSNTFVVSQGQAATILEGVGQGHGVGLCQRGASAMAQRGADFREIILHYFPNTTIGQVGPRHLITGR